jgi:hypothetical protein
VAAVSSFRDEHVVIAAVERRVECVLGREVGIGFADDHDLTRAGVSDAVGQILSVAAEICRVDQAAGAGDRRIDHREEHVVRVTATERRLGAVDDREVERVGVAGDVCTSCIVDGEPAARGDEAVLDARAAEQRGINARAGRVVFLQEDVTLIERAVVGVQRMREAFGHIGRRRAVDVDVARGIDRDA